MAHSHSHPETEIACAMAPGDVPTQPAHWGGVDVAALQARS